MAGGAAPIGPNNPYVKQLRRLLGRRSARRETGLYVIEGPKLVDEARAAGVDIEALFVDEDLAADDGAILVERGVLAKVGYLLQVEEV